MTTPVVQRDPSRRLRPRIDEPGGATDAGPAAVFTPGPVPGLLRAEPGTMAGGRRPSAVIRRNIVVGTGVAPTGKTYKTGDGGDRTKIGDQAANLATSANKPLARRLARWMLDQGHPHSFATNDKLRAYVDEMVRAITATAPNHWIGADYVDEPNPFPAAERSSRTGTETSTS